MDQNFFFRWVWRFNALALAAVLVLVGVVLSGVPFWQGISTIERLPGSNPSGSTLDMVRTVDGTGTVIFSYGDKSTFKVGTYPPPPFKTIANYLFYNPKDGSAHWLFPSNNQLITATGYVTNEGVTESDVPSYTRDLISDKSTSNTRHAITAIVFDVTPQANGGDGKKNYQVFVSRADGTQVTKLVDRADEVTTFVPLDATTIIVTHRRDGHALATTFSLTDFKPIIEKDLETFVRK